jgi:hypothetical protein
MASLRDLPLSFEEQTCLQDCRERWQAYIRSTIPLDRAAVESSIAIIYAKLERPKPKIYFHDSPLSVYRFLLDKLEFRVGSLIRDDLGKPLGTTFEQLFEDCFRKQLQMHLTDKFLEYLRTALEDKNYIHIEKLIGAGIGSQLQFLASWLLGWSLLGDQCGVIFDMLLPNQDLARLLHRGFVGIGTLSQGAMRLSMFEPLMNFASQGRYQQMVADGLGESLFGESGGDMLNCIRTSRWQQTAACFDFCTDTLGTPNTIPQQWRSFSTLMQACGWIWPFERVVLVSSRPNQLHLDKDGLPHGKEEPAITFSDGFCVSAHHGKLS